MKLRLAAAMYARNILLSEVLPEIAASAMEEGYDSPTLTLLAGETNPIMSNVGPLFERALNEVGIQLPNERDAANEIAMHYANQILNGEVTPYEGSSKIWRNSYSSELDYLSIFVGLASEWEDYEDIYGADSQRCLELQAEIEKRIISEAQILVSKINSKTV